MTNLVATVVLTLSTNWTTIGFFYPKYGPTYQDVQEGRIITNTIATFFWNDKGHEVLLDQAIGPIIGERKLPMPIKTFSNSPTNWWIPNLIYTNRDLVVPN